MLFILWFDVIVWRKPFCFDRVCSKNSRNKRERGLKELEVSPIIAGGLSDVIFDLEDVFCVKNVQLKEKTILSSLIMIHNQRSFDLSPSLGLPPLFRLILLYMYRNTDH